MPETFIKIPAEQLNEIPIAIATVIGIFVFLITTGTFFLIRYQKKRYEHLQHIFRLQKENEEAILRSQLEIQEQTFEAISLEIHDNVGQILSLAKVQLNIAQSTIDDPTGILASSKENIGRAMADLRDIANGLNTDRINRLDLSQAILHETEKINNTQCLSCLVEVTGSPQDIHRDKKLVLFRIVQETLNNVLKHAQASRVGIHLDYQLSQVAVAIHDNGTGFDLGEKSHKGLGLHNIQRRAALIGGEAVITSTLNEGTHVLITIPYE